MGTYWKNAPVPCAPRAPTQSPAVIAGLRRIATSLWLRFVASPQRMPIFRYRRWGRPVMNLIYRVPPRRRFLQHRQYLMVTNSRSTRCMAFFTRYRIRPAMLQTTRADLRIAPLIFLAYADPERVASGSASTLPQSSGRDSRGTTRLTAASWSGCSIQLSGCSRALSTGTDGGG